jgi:hypothetical protein
MQIRKLSPNEASRGYPVGIVGVITFCDLSGYLHFVQDDTSGIYVDLSRVENPSRLHSGVKVEIQGFSGPGDYAPILIAQTVRVLGEDSMPSPEIVTFRKLMRGNFDSQWVLLKGVVRNQWLSTNSSSLALFTGRRPDQGSDSWGAAGCPIGKPGGFSAGNSGSLPNDFR